MPSLNTLVNLVGNNYQPQSLTDVRANRDLARERLSLGNQQLALHNNAGEQALAQQPLLQNLRQRAIQGDQLAQIQLFAMKPQQYVQLQQTVVQMGAAQRQAESEKNKVIANQALMVVKDPNATPQARAQALKVLGTVATFEQMAKTLSPTAQSPEGKLNADLNSGLITQQQAAGAQERLNKPLVHIGEADAYDKKSAQNQATADQSLATEIDSSAAQAQQTQVTIARMKALRNEGVHTGAKEPYKYAIARWVGADGNTANQEELNRLSKQMAFVELAKFKGATSEKELKFAIDLVGNLGSQPQAFDRYLLVTDLVANRAIKASEEKNRYIQANGMRGLSNHMSQWRLDNPLIKIPKSDADFAKIKIGEVFVNPADGKMYIKQFEKQ